MHCPADLHYNHEQDKCLYRWEAGCDPNYSTIPDDATTTAESSPTDPPAEETTEDDGDIETTMGQESSTTSANDTKPNDTPYFS